MSWGEVKKVNSDLNVPLDERIGYVGGVIPRRIIRKNASKSVASAYSGTLLEIEGRGLVLLANVKSQINNANYYATMTINIDNGEKIIVLSVTGANAASIESDLDSNYCSDFDFSANEINVGANTSVIVNYPIYFEKSIKVDISLGSEAANYPTIANFGYALL